MGSLELLPPLADLERIAYNLRWTWDREARAIFRRLDPEGWRRTRHNPVLLLQHIDRAVLARSASDPQIIAHVRHGSEVLDEYLEARSTTAEPRRVAYFSAEFAITECIRVFSGGLGVLAGDHLKSASDLGLPLVGVGLLYRDGYFTQHVDGEGWQHETYRHLEPTSLPLRAEMTARGTPLIVQVPFPGRVVSARVWRADVGAVPLYLLDTDVAPNTVEDRHITDRLYGGDLEHRIRQELVLGIGGVRVLAALGLPIETFHLNEGHAAFAIVERARQLMGAESLDFEAALARATDETVFTTHTPVEAGHDWLPPELMSKYFCDYVAALGIPWDRFYALGLTSDPHRHNLFCMTALALRGARVRNGVSRLHGEVTRRMWHGIWPGRAVEDVPIGHVTNGVHLPSWVGPHMSRVYGERIAPDWQARSAAADWSRIRDVPAGRLWAAHQAERARLVDRLRVLVAAQARARGADFDGAAARLRRDALIITFARRFATYKRATLLLRDIDRLARLTSGPDRPVHFIFAGKAHPRDDGGKQFLRDVFTIAQRSEFLGRVIFVENYDIELARYLVRGSDVWLNVPRRPYEASGTSGMKAAANGGLNVSIADGWWAEAWTERNDGDAPIGWVVTADGQADPAQQDAADATALYDVLENEVIPLFFERDERGLPTRWIEMMRAAISQICPFFNTDRTVAEYAEAHYRLTPQATRTGGPGD
jgi:starch phosphorylase